MTVLEMLAGSSKVPRNGEYNELSFRVIRNQKQREESRWNRHQIFEEVMLQNKCWCLRKWKRDLVELNSNLWGRSDNGWCWYLWGNSMRAVLSMLKEASSSDWAQLLLEWTAADNMKVPFWGWHGAQAHRNKSILSHILTSNFSSSFYWQNLAH